LEELKLPEKSVTQVSLEATGVKEEAKTEKTKKGGKTKKTKKTKKPKLKMEAMERLTLLRYEGYEVEVVSDSEKKRTVRFWNEKKDLDWLELELGVYKQKNDKFKKNGHYVTRLDEESYRKPQVDWHY
jgi:hypothetical protein